MQRTNVDYSQTFAFYFVCFSGRFVLQSEPLTPTKQWSCEVDIKNHTCEGCNNQR